MPIFMKFSWILRKNYELESVYKFSLFVIPAPAGNQTSSLWKQGTILNTGFPLPDQVEDKFRGNDKIGEITTFYETLIICKIYYT